MAYKYKRGNVWWIKYYVDGKEIRHSLKTKDRTVAKYLLNKKEIELSRGPEAPPPKNISIEIVLSEYLEASRTKKTPATIRNEQSWIRHYLNWSKASTLAGITAVAVDKYLHYRMTTPVPWGNHKRHQPIGPKTADHIIESLRAFLNFCIRRNYLVINPLSGFKKFRQQQRPPRFLSKEEIDRILEVSKNESIYPMLMTAMYTGMRLGELCRLRWEDIDLKQKTIMAVMTKGKRFRVIPIHPDLEPFISPSNVPFPTKNLTRIFRRIRRKSCVQGFGWHILRHSFASYLVMSGVDLYTVSQLLGHKDLSTTQIYAHLSPEHLRQSINRLQIGHKIGHTSENEKRPVSTVTN